MIAAEETRRGPFVAILMLVVSLLLLVPATTMASGDQSVVRLGETMDETYILGKGDVEWSYAEPNLTLEEGDLLQTDETGMAEIQFGGGLVLRIGERSRMAIIEIGDERIIGLDSGRVYTRIARDISEEGELTLTFPSGEVLASDRALVRVDVFEGGKAELRVLRGEVELDPKAEGSSLVRAGECVIISPEGFTEVKALELATRDDFDKWNEERDIALSRYRRPVYIEEEILGAEDLEDYGEWIYAKRYSTYAWRPYVVKGWKPYSQGLWVHRSFRGWTWLPSEPWGYATHHYGSWDYDPYYGWVWIPGYEWSPAYVSWVEYDGYVGWVPLGYYGYPVVTTYPYYVTGSYINCFDTFSFSFVYWDHFHDYRCYDHHRGRRCHYDRHDRHSHDRHGDRHDHDGRNNRHDRDDHNNNDGGEAHGGGNNWHKPKPQDFDKIRLDGQLRATDKGRPADPKITKDGKARFMRNVGDLKLAKDIRKQKPTHQDFDHVSLLDVDKYPGLKKKAARLDEKRQRNEKRRAASFSEGLPKRMATDQIERFDFRSRTKAFKRNADKQADRTVVLPNNRVHRGVDAKPTPNRERVTLKRPENEGDVRKIVALQGKKGDAFDRTLDRNNMARLRPTSSDLKKDKSRTRTEKTAESRARSKISQREQTKVSGRAEEFGRVTSDRWELRGIQRKTEKKSRRQEQVNDRISPQESRAPKSSEISSHVRQSWHRVDSTRSRDTRAVPAERGRSFSTRGSRFPTRATVQNQEAPRHSSFESIRSSDQRGTRSFGSQRNGFSKRANYSRVTRGSSRSFGGRR